MKVRTIAKPKMMLHSDSGVISRFQPATYQKPGLVGWVQNISKKWGKNAANESYQSNETSVQGSSYFTSPAVQRYLIWQERYENRSIIAMCHEMFDTDPRINKSIWTHATEAVRGGVNISIGDDNTNKPKLEEHAKKIMAMANKSITQWAMLLFVEGNLYVQGICKEGGGLIDAQKVPSDGMERCSDDNDNFADTNHAFAQVDVNTNQEIATWAEWQMYHQRWNYEGGRYGRSGLWSTRRIYALMQDLQEAQAIRRLSRASIKILWSLGNPDNTGQTEDIENFKMENGIIDANGNVNPYDPREITRNYFSNGLADAKVIEGDANIHQIDDLKWVEEIFTASLPCPPQVYGLHTTETNTEILTSIRAQWLLQTELLSDAMVPIIKWLFELSLLIDGIVPENINYQIHFSKSYAQPAEQRIDTLLKLYNNSVKTPVGNIWQPMVTKQTLLQDLADYVTIDDVGDYENQLKIMVEELTQDAMAKAGIIQAAQVAQEKETSPTSKETSNQPPKVKAPAISKNQSRDKYGTPTPNTTPYSEGAGGGTI